MVKVWAVYHEGRELLFEDFGQFVNHLQTIEDYDDPTDVIISTRTVARAEFEALPETSE